MVIVNKLFIIWAFRYWTNDGICWARNTNVHDIDDTVMAFRVLRMHGYEVSPGLFPGFGFSTLMMFLVTVR